MATPTGAARLILLHGFSLTGRSWDAVLAALPAACRAGALAPDLRGHGTSSSVSPVSLDRVVEDVLGLGDEDGFALAGYSMGGRIALHVALAAPRRVSRLVLIGASPGLADPRERAARRRADEALARQVETIGIAAFAERWAQTPVLAGQPARVRADAHADRLRSTPEGLAAALRGLGTGALPSLWQRLDRLEMPVTLIAGERDARFRALAAAMAARIPGAEVEIVPGTGHAVHLEAPERVSALLSRASNGR